MTGEDSVVNDLQQLKISQRRTIERKYHPYTSPSEIGNKDAEEALLAMCQIFYSLSAGEASVQATEVCALFPIIEKGFQTECMDQLMTTCLFPLILAELSLLHESLTDPQVRKKLNDFFHKYTNADCSLDATVELYYDIRDLDPEADFFLGVIDYKFPAWMTF